MSTTYIEAIGTMYPNVGCHCVGDGSVYDSIIWDSGDPIPSQADLDTAILQLKKDKKWAEIKALRDSKKAGGVFISSVNGTAVNKWFHSDDASRIQYIGLVMLGANIPANLQWKTMDNTFVTITQAIATTIFNTIAYYDQTNFANAETHRLAMLASSDPETYDYSSGWLPVFGG